MPAWDDTRPVKRLWSRKDGRTPDFRRASQEAKRLLRTYDLTKPPFDPERIARSEGLRVVYAEFESPEAETVSGFFDLENKMIVVNKAIFENRITFTIAHELGHFCLHKSYIESNNYQPMPRFNDYSEEKPIEEIEADTFAANLLVPLNVLARYTGIANGCELARLFFVSEDVIGNRLDLLKRHPGLAGR